MCKDPIFIGFCGVKYLAGMSSYVGENWVDADVFFPWFAVWEASRNIQLFSCSQGTVVIQAENIAILDVSKVNPAETVRSKQSPSSFSSQGQQQGSSRSFPAWYLCPICSPPWLLRTTFRRIHGVNNKASISLNVLLPVQCVTFH